MSEPKPYALQAPGAVHLGVGTQSGQMLAGRATVLRTALKG